MEISSMVEINCSVVCDSINAPKCCITCLEFISNKCTEYCFKAKDISKVFNCAEADIIIKESSYVANV